MNLIYNNLMLKYQTLREDNNIQKLYHFFKNKKYIVLFLKQYEFLISNLYSMIILVDANLIEDAFTIFRKYLETYFTLMCIVNHPDLVPCYLEHNDYLSDKVTNKNREKIKELRKTHPDGYIEYGYIDKYLNDTKTEKYTIKMVATVAGVKSNYEYYNKSSNFVHNNLTSVNVDLVKAKNALNAGIKNTIELLIKAINNILETQ